MRFAERDQKRRVLKCAGGNISYSGEWIRCQSLALGIIQAHIQHHVCRGARRGVAYATGDFHALDGGASPQNFGTDAGGLA